MARRFTLFSLFFLCGALPLLGDLKFTEIRPAIEELLSHHVEQNAFSETIAKRSLGVLLSRFDPENLYFLEKEVKDLFSPEEMRLKKIVSGYQKGDFSEYQNLAKGINLSIHRARKMRALIKTILLEDKTPPQKGGKSRKKEFSHNEEELYQNTESLMRSWLASYAEEKGKQELDRDERFKIINHYEKKRREHEENFLLHFDKKKTSFPLQIVKAIASSLDAHTMFYSQGEAEEIRNLLHKEFCGVGFVLREGVDGPFITSLLPKSPAALSQVLEVGDVLKEVDGVEVDSIYFQEVLKKLSGKEHTSVTLAFLKPSGKKVTTVLKRQKIILENERIQVEAEPFADGVLGVITLSAFYDNNEGISVEKDLKEAIKDLKARGPIYGLVLDFRKNAGGFLHQAVKVSSLFIQKGLVVIAKYAQNEIRYAKGADPIECYTGPLIILTSKASASAAEIVAQSLKDEGLALIVGDRRTYGKGSMQYQTLTDENAKNFYKVTVGKYFTASGNSPQIQGVEADILVPTLFTPYQIGEKYLRYPLKHETLALKTDMKEEVKRLVSFYQRRARTKWEQMIPILQKNSQLRQEEDKNFKAFIDYSQGRFQEKEPSLPLFGSQDLQVKEAISILKDMIFLSK